MDNVIEEIEPKNGNTWIKPQPLKFRKRHEHDKHEAVGEEQAIDFTGDPGMTIQEPTEDADINILMKRMGVTDGSTLPHFPNPRALYGDFSEMPETPQELAEMMREGQLNFMKIPAEIRQRYRTPEELFTWMEDDNNHEEAVKLGLIEKKLPPVKDPIERLNDNLERLSSRVSSSTSSDKETLVQTSNSKENK